MIKILKKKLINIITFSLICIIIGGTICGNLLVNINRKDEPLQDLLNRGKNYRHFSLINQLKKEEGINNLVKVICDNNHYMYVISEENFRNNMKQIVQNCLKKINLFARNYLAYKIECNYKILSDKINLDIIWFLSSNYVKYYDQFVISLDNN